MPTYEYTCGLCGAEFEEFHSMNVVCGQCPECGSPDVRKDFRTPASYIWKASGKTRFSVEVRTDPFGKKVRYTADHLGGTVDPTTGLDYLTGQRFTTLDEREKFLNARGMKTADENAVPLGEVVKQKKEKLVKEIKKDYGHKLNQIVRDMRASNVIKQSSGEGTSCLKTA